MPDSSTTEGTPKGVSTAIPAKEIYGFDVFGIHILGYDELGRPITNDPFGDMIRNKMMEWHDDDWCEEPD